MATRFMQTIIGDALRWLTEESTPGGRLELCWLGQASFILRSDSFCAAADLYLSDTLAEKYRDSQFPHTRMNRAPITPEELASTPLDLMLCTHGHTDHMDPGTLGPMYEGGDPQLFPLCAVPRYEAGTALDRGVPIGKMILLDAGESFSLEHASVTALASSHEELVTDKFGNCKFLGYIIETAGIRIYHSGDSIPYAGLSERLSSLHVDIALLPVNGRDSYRAMKGIPGNFSVEEACTLVREAGIPFWIPHHFNMFSFNTVSPIEISRVISLMGFTEGKDCIIPQAGAVYRFMQE